MIVFLSYTRTKEEFNDVSLFRARLEQELSMRMPGTTVFQDTQNLSAGQHFPEELESALHHADIFLALVSPEWLHSDWCRREFSKFTINATDAGWLHRILPILWGDTPQLSLSSLDVVARTLAGINYSDWRDLHYEDWQSPDKRRQLGKLAESIIALTQTTAVNQGALQNAKLGNRFQYGVYWTEDGTPLCNKCSLPLTRIMWTTHLNQQVEALQCSCSGIPIVLMEKGEPIQAIDAMKKMAHG